MSDTYCITEDVDGNAPQGEFKPGRIQHLTSLRGILLKQIRKKLAESPDHYDFVLMYDGDLFAAESRGFDPVSLFALMGMPQLRTNVQYRGKLAKSSSEQESHVPAFLLYADDPYDMVCANQMVGDGMYRDTFALRFNVPPDPNEGFKRHVHYFKGNRLVNVGSCFSGLALYKASVLVLPDCGYEYVNEETCEHVPYHMCLHRAGHGKFALYPPLWVVVNQQNVDLGGPMLEQVQCGELGSFFSEVQ